MLLEVIARGFAIVEHAETNGFYIHSDSLGARGRIYRGDAYYHSDI